MLFSLLDTIVYKHRVTSASHNSRRCYLKANKIGKSEGQGKLNIHVIFESVLMLCAKKNIKISPCLPKPQLAKVSAF